MAGITNWDRYYKAEQHLFKIRAIITKLCSTEGK